MLETTSCSYPLYFHSPRNVFDISSNCIFIAISIYAIKWTAQEKWGTLMFHSLLARCAPVWVYITIKNDTWCTLGNIMRSCALWLQILNTGNTVVFVNNSNQDEVREGENSAVCLTQRVWQDHTSDDGSPTGWSISCVTVHQTKNTTHKNRNIQYGAQLSNSWRWPIYWQNGEEYMLHVVCSHFR